MKRIGSVIIAALLSVAAYAQVGPPPPREGFAHGGFRGGPGLHGGKLVTGAPFSATITNEVTQTLAGGNTIHRVTTGTVARDSQGRTVTQETITGGPLGGAASRTLTFISDPVAGYSYTLDASNKTATRHAIHAPTSASGAPTNRDEATSKNPNVTVATSTGSYLGHSVQIKTITRTIPAGEIGNAAPIVSTSQVYYSPDLQTVLYSTRNDPRSGVSTYKLTDIQTAEPAAAAFQVPSDYTLEDGHARGLRRANPLP